tara:strand:+ start:265 stop:507 length:243 start_codon:yes stop_codon:yes gene_type:complete
MKIEDNEINEIKQSVEEHKTLFIKLGEVNYQLDKLKIQKKLIIESIDKILQDRNKTMDTLTKKYGAGRLNIDTGELTVTK